MDALQRYVLVTIRKSMLKYKSIIYTASCLLFSVTAFSQTATSESASNDSILNSDKNSIQVGLTFDYLKLHHLITTGNKKFEGALNIAFRDKYHLIGSYGTANVSSESLYKNANNKVEGNYIRLGIDYSFSVNPDNRLMLGLRYAQSNFNEVIQYKISNPLFENETGTINRENSNASWFEIVLTTEKRLNRILNMDLNNMLAVGMKFRLKSGLNYTAYDFAPTKYVAGYGLTNTKINPEINLYIKFRFQLLSR